MRPATIALIIVNVVVYGAQQIWLDPLVTHFALWPIDSSVGFEPWQLVTSAFLHASSMHILFNMFGLYMFGSGVEQYLGSRKFLALYFAAVLSAAVTQLIVMGHGADEYTLGASGGVFGVLLAFGWLFPRSRVTLLFPPIPMPAWLFVTIYGAIELGSGVFGVQSGVAHFAHLGGMVGALVLLLLLIPRRAPTRPQ
jgi:membrane associated rhomboid family serine protease